MLCLAVVLVAVLTRDEGPTFALVAAIATGLLALLVAAGVRVAWTRLRGSRTPVVAPSLLLIAATISLAVAGARAAQEGADQAAREDAAEQCTAESPGPFPPAAGDVSYEALTPVEAQSMRREAGFLTDTRVAAGTQVLVGDRPLANIVAIPGYQEPDRRDELLERLDEAASAGAIEVRPVQDLEQPGRLAVIRGKARLITTTGCYAVLIGGEAEESVLYVARTLFPGDGTGGG